MIVPQILRADRGSENVLIGGLQRFFRREHGDAFSGVRSFRYGSSTANQRIEAWWSILRRSRTNWWINYFKDMIDEAFLTRVFLTMLKQFAFVIWVFYRMSSMKLSVYGIVTV